MLLRYSYSTIILVICDGTLLANEITCFLGLYYIKSYLYTHHNIMISLNSYLDIINNKEVYLTNEQLVFYFFPSLLIWLEDKLYITSDAVFPLLPHVLRPLTSERTDFSRL